MTKKVTTSRTEIAGMKLETETVFDSVSDARAWLNDNYTTGDFMILWDDFFGAYIYNSDP